MFSRLTIARGKGDTKSHTTTISILPEIAKMQHEKYKKELLQVLDLQTSDMFANYYNRKTLLWQIIEMFFFNNRGLSNFLLLAYRIHLFKCLI